MHAPLILGAGPAGLAVALCCREIGLQPVVVDPAPEGAPLGGLIALSRWPAIWTPWSEEKTGEEIGRDLAARFLRAGIPRWSDEALALDPARRVVRLKHGGETPYRALVVATGVAFRRLDLPGGAEAEAAGWLLQRPPLRPEAATPAGGTVVILGGGDNAFSTAVTEAKKAARVVVAVRGEHPRASARLVAEAAALPNIVLRSGWHPRAFLPEHAVRFETSQGETLVEPCDLAYVNLGYTPRSAFAVGALRQNEGGWIEVDASFRTSAPGVWAVGEVVGPKAPSVLTVMGHAPTVAGGIAAALEDGEERERLVAGMRKR